MSKSEYIKAMLPHATAAIGSQHPWLITWALAKSIIETGANLENVLIKNANNCMGTKAEVNGVPIAGVDFFLCRANTGPETGGHIYWRRFPTLQACFLEFANQVNYREAYKPFRNLAVVGFENIYVSGLAGHAEQVLKEIGVVRDSLALAGLMDEKGRLNGL